jgi:lia operon protein LiaI
MIRVRKRKEDNTMKNFLLVAAAIALGFIAIASLGGIIGIAIGVGIAYYAVKSFIKSDSLLGKLGWGIAGLIGLSIALGNFPALIGIGAIALLYYGYKEWKKEKHDCHPSDTHDSFHNFEREWNELSKKY